MGLVVLYGLAKEHTYHALLSSCTAEVALCQVASGGREIKALYSCEVVNSSLSSPPAPPGTEGAPEYREAAAQGVHGGQESHLADGYTANRAPPEARLVARWFCSLRLFIYVLDHCGQVNVQHYHCRRLSHSQAIATDMDYKL